MTKAKIKRMEIIRGIIAGVRASGRDLRGQGSEVDIADVIADRLKD